MSSDSQMSDLVADLLTRWEDSIESGVNLTPDEICNNHPELKEIVTKQLKKLKRMRWLTSTWDSNESEFLPIGINIADRFEIECVLGSGGFGTVYQAKDKQLLRSIAIKIANPNRSDPDTLLAEARKAASIKHPNIITVHDVGRHDGRIFIVSQLIEGRNLKDVAYSDKPSAMQSSLWMLQVAEALSVAHKQGLVHRDLKPSNIIINNDQQALVSDFGIAFHTHEIDQIEPLTGTLLYMAPEQVQAESSMMGPKSDIFSLGVMLYELLSGKHPFLSKSSSETIRKITIAKPEPLTDAPVQLQLLCEQCLSVHPEERPSASQIVARLKEFLEVGERSSILPTFMPFLISFLLVAGLGGVAWWQLGPVQTNKDSINQASTRVSPLETTNPSSVNLLQVIHLPSHVISGTWTSDGGVLKVDGLTSPAGGVIQIPYQPKGSYRLTIRARRQRYGGIIVPVVFAGRQFGVFLAAGYEESKDSEHSPRGLSQSELFSKQRLAHGHDRG